MPPEVLEFLITLQEPLDDPSELVIISTFLFEDLASIARIQIAGREEDPAKLGVAFWCHLERPRRT